MDINKLLNPSARGVAVPCEIIDEDPLQSNRSSTTSSKVSRQHGYSRGQVADEHHHHHHRHHKYATVGSSNGGSMTARSSISSLASLQSSNSLTSLTTLSSTGSISKGSLGSPIHDSLGRSKPDFRIPIYAYDITQNSARPPPRGLYTPSESDYSPSTTMTQYFPPHSEVTQERIARDGPGSNLTTLAALATSQDLKGHPFDSDYGDSRQSYGASYYDGASSRSYVSQMRQRADLVPKQPSPYGHVSTQDVYAMSKLQLSGTPSTQSPTNTIGPSSSTHSIIHNFDADLFSAPKCSYVEDCNTSSPLRKVVSHIFGRNKLSTRQIPKNIWVYYCRKHYQRSRYRDPKGFAKLQCDLVRRQVERLDAWGGVEDWMIKVRRREEIRISKESKSVAPHSPDGSDGFDDNYSRRSSISQGSPDIHWISMMTGTGKNVEDVRFLLQKIESEIIDHGGIFPDVEILPNVRPSAIAVDMGASRIGDGEHGLEPILEGSKAKKSRGSLIDAFISPRKLPSRKSLEEAMVVTGSTVSAQAKLQKSNRPSFIQEYSPPSLDDEDTPSPTRPKRKASKPLPITVLPPEDPSLIQDSYYGYGYPQMPTLPEGCPNAETERLLKYRSKRVRPVYPNFNDSWDEPPSPVSTRRHSLDLDSDVPPLPFLAEKLEEQLRSPSTEDLTLAGLPLKPAQATGEAFCSFEQKDLKIVLVTPPPSIYGDYSRAPSEQLETIDGEIAQLGVIEAQPLLAIDPESERTVLAVEVPQHVRDFVMGSWSKKRAVRMKNLFGDQIAKPTESRLLGYRTPRRKPSPSDRNPSTRRIGPTQDYVEFAKESVRSSVRQLRTSFALQSEPTEESMSLPSRKSFSLLTKSNPNNNTPPINSASSNRRRHRASSAGPAGRSSNPNLSMKRALTTTPKGALEPSRTLTRGTSNSRII
ncbi:hypothetical protein TWF694_004965 [Orbilia ellipsospora]|uniref:Uncharacterized protein n=1 Tax=Orbilia ellipsospora TaxID=2528407 RepID=A0AAV9WWA2_9PEZI